MSCVGIEVGIEIILSTSLIQATEGQKFFLHVFVDAVSALTPEPALFHTAERDGRVGDGRSVDSDHANFQRLGDPPDSTDVSRIEVTSKPDIGVVSQLDHLLLGFEFNQGCDGSESLFLTEERRWSSRDIRKDGRLVERARKVGSPSANKDLCPF